MSFPQSWCSGEETDHPTHAPASWEKSLDKWPTWWARELRLALRVGDGSQTPPASLSSQQTSCHSPCRAESTSPHQQAPELTMGWPTCQSLFCYHGNNTIMKLSGRKGQLMVLTHGHLVTWSPGDLAFGSVARHPLWWEHMAKFFMVAGKQRERKERPGFPSPLYGHISQLPNFVPLGPTP